LRLRISLPEKISLAGNKTVITPLDTMSLDQGGYKRCLRNRSAESSLFGIAF
jgi:hypothetical protein